MSEEIEDDVAEMVCHLADGEIDNVVMCTGGNTEVVKQQFRDALAKFIDGRIKASRLHVHRVERKPFVIDEE